MKYGYRFMDWGLFDIDELEEVTESEEDYITKDCFGEHTFKKDEWVWAKACKPIFLVPYYDGHYYRHNEVYEGPYYKKHIFDTKEEAQAYGREHSRCFLF